MRVADLAAVQEQRTAEMMFFAVRTANGEHAFLNETRFLTSRGDCRGEVKGVALDKVVGRIQNKI